MFLPRSVIRRPPDSAPPRNPTKRDPHHKHASPSGLSSSKFATPSSAFAAASAESHVGSPAGNANPGVSSPLGETHPEVDIPIREANPGVGFPIRESNPGVGFAIGEANPGVISPKDEARPDVVSRICEANPDVGFSVGEANPDVGSSKGEGSHDVALNPESVPCVELSTPAGVPSSTFSVAHDSSSNLFLLPTESQAPSANGSSSIALTDCEDNEDESPVKLKSLEQRAAQPGEPTCVICGRYGEYICDLTDDDVCSVECKVIVLDRAEVTATSLQVNRGNTLSSLTQTTPDGSTKRKPVAIHFRDSLPSMQDESEVIVRDGEKSLPEWEPDSCLRALTAQQVDGLRAQIGISVKGDDVPSPIVEFQNCKFPSKLQANMESMGFETPTPVQMQVIPAALKKRDLLVSAGTGSGKTAGYLLFVVSRCSLIRSHYQLDSRKPLAIVLTPTRELSEQVELQAKGLAKGLPFKTALVVGGDAMPQQIYRIGGGVELIVATPGRLIDLLEKHDVELDDVCVLVIDEVDSMLDRGFRDEVLQIRTALTRPQILMFSATIPPDIVKLSTALMNRPVVISVGQVNAPSGAVKQTVIWVETNRKKKKLFDIMMSPNHFRPPVVVFVNSRIGAELLADSIKSATGLRAVAVHGEKPMTERRQALRDFLEGDLPVIVATGELGRGLDLIRVTQVIIFDMPLSIDEYVHQIGRSTTVGGHPGSAMVFINDESKILFKDFVELLRRAGVVIPKELLNSPYATSSYAVAYNPKKRKSYRKGRNRGH